MMRAEHTFKCQMSRAKAQRGRLSSIPEILESTARPVCGWSVSLRRISDKIAQSVSVIVSMILIAGCAQIDPIEGIGWLSDHTDWEETYKDAYQSSRYHEYRDRGFSKNDARYGAMVDRFETTGEIEF